MTSHSNRYVSMIDTPRAMTHTSNGHILMINIEPTINLISTSHRRQLSNLLAKTYTNETIYSS